MSLQASRGNSARTAPVIAVLAVLMLGAMAAAIPPPAIRPAETRRAMLLGPHEVSESRAQQLASEGYSALVVDLSRAGISADALWVQHLRAVAGRGFPVAGWLDARVEDAAARAQAAARLLPLATLYVYGGAAPEAGALRVVEVSEAQVVKPEGLAREGLLVLDASGLTPVQIARLVEDREGDLIVSRTPHLR